MQEIAERLAMESGQNSRRLAIAAAVTFVSASLLATTCGSDAQAHPFGFDTSHMVGFDVLTSEDGALQAKNVVVIEYDGPIVFPMAENLRTIWNEVRGSVRFNRVVLRLNSPGGTDEHGRKVIEVLSDIRRSLSFATLVEEGDLCASMCIAVYLQGETRYASPASSWMFHGASKHMSNVPSLAMTERYFDLFRQRNIDGGFVDFLFEHNYVTTSGGYWISGYELASESNIITNLLPNWRPAYPDPGPTLGIRGGI